MSETTFGSRGGSDWADGGGRSHSEFCFGHLGHEFDGYGMGLGVPGESRCVDFDEDEGLGYGPDGPDADRKPLDEYTTKELGAEGERLAANYLADNGYRILDMNWRCRAGEVDIVATEDEPDEEMHHSVVLVEVKTRLALGDEAEYMPEIAVDPKKQERYRLLGLLYLVEHTNVDSVRFDVVAVNVVGHGHAKLRHLVCAFSWDD